VVAKSICFLKILERLGWSKAFPAVENNASNKTNKKASDSNMCRLLLGFVDSCCLIVWEDAGRPCCPVVLPAAAAAGTVCGVRVVLAAPIAAAVEAL
jgi:hypothetical protein